MMSSTGSQPDKRAAYFLGATVIIALCLRLLVTICLHPLRIGWDPALHLMCAVLICRGKLPYVDMFDVNPPLIWYINTLPASISEALNWPVTITFNLFLLALICLAASMCVYVIVAKLKREQTFVHLGVLAGLVLFNFFLSVDFGQREEIFAVLFMPFAFLRLWRWQSSQVKQDQTSSRKNIAVLTAVAYGLVGAIGLMMKHYFVLNFIAVEFYFLVSFVPFSFNKVKDALKQLKAAILTPEIFTVIAFAAIYLGHFFLLPPLVRHNYFDFLVPAFARGYSFWDTSVANCLSAPGKRDVIYGALAACVAAFGLARLYPMLGALISFTLVSIVVYLMQFKGWPYQDIPVFAGASMLGCAVGVYFLERLLSKKIIARRLSKNLTCYVVSALIVFLCARSAYEEIELTSHFPTFDMATLGYRGLSPAMDIDSPFTDTILRYSKPRDPIVFVSNAVAPAFPITMQLRREAGSRHLHVCILSVLQAVRSSCVRDNEVKRLLAFEPRVVKELGEDILKNRPPLVFMQDAPIKFEYLAPYDFGKRYLYHYSELPQIMNFSVYRLDKPDAVAPEVPPFPERGGDADK